jgi:hypothetical protein
VARWAQVAGYTFTNIQAAHTIAATFSLNSFPIAASAGAGGTITPSGTASVNCGADQAFTVHADDCYSIADVAVDGGSIGAASGYTFTNVQTAHTITATFSLNGPYTIDASAGTGGTIAPNGAVSVACGADQAFSLSANDCYTVADVAVDGGSLGAISSYTFTNVHGTHSIAATFSLNGPYAIAASAGSGGSITPDGDVSVACGADQSFAVAPNDCYSIADVTVDGGSIGAVAGYTFTNVHGTHTIAATFSLNGPYTIAASAGTGGTIAPAGEVFDACGASQEFTITANDCYSIADVAVDGGSIGAVTAYTFTNMHANHTIAATFSLNGPYTIDASAGTGGAILPSGAVSVACGADQAFTVHVDDCYSIADVAVDGSSLGAVWQLHVHECPRRPHDRRDVQLQRSVHDRCVGRHGRLDCAERCGRGRLRHGSELHRDAGRLLLDRRRRGRRRLGGCGRHLHLHQRPRWPHDRGDVQPERPVRDRRLGRPGRHDPAERRGVRGVRRGSGVHGHGV